MTPTVAEAEVLIADVGERVRFMIHENYHFRPHHAGLAARLREGQVGRLRPANRRCRRTGWSCWARRTR